LFCESSAVPASKPIIAELRETLSAIHGDAHRDRPTMPFGVAAIDAKLADGGLRLDALHEAAGEGVNWADDAAAVLFLAGIAARTDGPILWVVRTRDLFAPGLYQAGLDPARLLYAEARDDAELLALMEEGLRHRGLAAVIGEARRVPMAATRRLQLAAEGGNTIALLLKRTTRTGDDAFGMPSAAVTRWRVASAPSAPVPWQGLGRACWRLSCVRQRGGDPFDLTVEAPDETGRLALPAELVDRPAAAGRAPQRAVG
jgi:protein ImuA